MKRQIGFARWQSNVASGGNRYDDELSAGLRTLGLNVREYPVTGAWPDPAPIDRQRFAELLVAEHEWLVGNIVASAAPDVIKAATAAGRRVTMLLHYFPADDPKLERTVRDGLAAAEAEAVAAATTVITTSEWSARELDTRYGRSDAIVAVPGVELAEISPGSTSGGHAPMLLWLAGLTETKDPLTFIGALSQLRDLDWTARLTGPDTVDEALSSEVRDRIHAADLAERVEVVGELHGEPLERVWSCADLLVHTSRTETYGMVVSEALAHGVPSIVPEGTGAIEAQQGAGASFPLGDVDALAVALRAWLVDPVLRSRWRSDAAERRAILPTWQETARVVAAALTH